ncbi:MAG: hypothetical protein ABI574_08190 [Burkholderiales bacterium]
MSTVPAHPLPSGATASGDESVALRASAGLRVVPLVTGRSAAPIERGDLDALLHETEDALQRSYLLDAASGLLHRELFLDRLNQAAAGVTRGGTCFSVMLLNVSLPTGRIAPPAVLGRRMVELSRRSDSYAQLDARSYAGLLPGNHTVAGSVAMATKLVESLSRAVVVDGVALYPEVFAGVALCPQHGNDARRVLLSAHAALSQAHTMGRAVSVYASRLA